MNLTEILAILMIVIGLLENTIKVLDRTDRLIQSLKILLITEKRKILELIDVFDCDYIMVGYHTDLGVKIKNVTPNLPKNSDLDNVIERIDFTKEHHSIDVISDDLKEKLRSDLLSYSITNIFSITKKRKIFILLFRSRKELDFDIFEKIVL